MLKDCFNIFTGSKYSSVSVMEYVEWKMSFRHICLPQMLHKKHIEPCEHRPISCICLLSVKISIGALCPTHLNDKIGDTKDFCHGVAQILG